MLKDNILPKRGRYLWLIGFVIFGVMSVSPSLSLSADTPKEEKEKSSDYQSYIDFFEEVYKTILENYYHPVNREDFDRFVEAFDTKIYSKLQQAGKSENYIKWRSSAKLIEFLKSPEDRFSAFYPPKEAEKYEKEVLGKKIDVGMKGEFTDEGYVISRMEPRSDSYLKGVRVGDILKFIDDMDVKKMSEKELKDLLSPFEGQTILVTFYDVSENKEKTFEIESKEYFHQTVFLFPVDVPGIFGLEIRRFNRKTSEDMLTLLNFIKQQTEDSSLIIDLRGNPGGPPLAAREISSFFLTPGEEFTYFKRRDKPKDSLDVPTIPEKYHYKGDIVILVNEKSGSSSELFSGVMQKEDRAILIGQNTAGQVFLKSMFNFEDDSMLLLVTARGHFPDGEVFPFEGLTPDRLVSKEEDEDVVDLATKVLIYLKQNPKN